MSFVPVICGGYVSGYSIARTIYTTYKKSSIICEHKRRFSRYSNFCITYKVTEPKKNMDTFISQIVDLGKKLQSEGKKPLLIATNDEWLIPLSKNKEVLDSFYTLTFPHWDVIKNFFIKENLYEMCKRININYPKTLYINPLNLLNTDLGELATPIMLKPSNKVSFLEAFPGKSRYEVFTNIDKLRTYLEESFKNGYSDSFIIQEYIPGGIENLYTATTFTDKNGELKGLSIGHKLTQHPSKAGTITAGIINIKKEVEAIEEPVRRLLKELNYFGMANTEFKYDKRNDEFMIIEVNSRPGTWNYSSFASGANLVELMIESFIYNNDLQYRKDENNVLWTVIGKNELLRKIKGTPDYDFVLNCFVNNQMVDPRKNSEENFLYKLNLLCFILLDRIKRVLS